MTSPARLAALAGAVLATLGVAWFLGRGSDVRSAVAEPEAAHLAPGPAARTPVRTPAAEAERSAAAEPEGRWRVEVRLTGLTEPLSPEPAAILVRTWSRSGTAGDAEQAGGGRWSLPLAERLTLDVHALVEGRDAGLEMLLVRVDHPEFLRASGVLSLPRDGEPRTLPLEIALPSPSATVAGILAAADGSPLEGGRAVLHELDARGRPRDEVLAEARPGRDGAFRLGLTRAVPCVLLAYDSENKQWRPATRRLRPRDGEVLDVGRIELAPGATIAGRIAVRGALDRADLEVHCWIGPESRPPDLLDSREFVWIGEAFEWADMAVPCGQDGAFRITGAAPGPYLLLTEWRPRPGLRRRHMLQVASLDAARARVDAPAENVELELEAARAIVRIESCGTPLPGAHLSVHFPRGFDATSVDERGEAEVLLDPTQPCRLSAEHPGHVRQERSIGVADLDAEGRIVFDLEPALESAVVVLHPNGPHAALLEQCWVDIEIERDETSLAPDAEVVWGRRSPIQRDGGRESDGPSVLTLERSPDGMITMEEVEPGPLRLRVQTGPRTPEGPQGLVLPFSVLAHPGPGQRAEIPWPVELGAGLELELRDVRARSQTPVTRLIRADGVEVELDWQGTRDSPWHGGSFPRAPGVSRTVRPIAPGLYTLRVEVIPPLERDVELRAGERTRISTRD